MDKWDDLIPQGYLSRPFGYVGELFTESQIKAFARQLREAWEKEQRCPYCDGTGDVHSIDGEWRGYCSCPAGDVLKQQPTESRTEIEAPIVGYHFSRMSPFGQVVWDVDHAAHPDAIEVYPLVRASKPSAPDLSQASEQGKVERDAMRYRWLRGGKEIPPYSHRWPRWDVRNWDGRYWYSMFAEQLDQAIDAAMLNDAKEGKG